MAAALRSSPLLNMAAFRQGALRQPASASGFMALRSFHAETAKKAPKPTNVYPQQPLPQDGSFIKGTVNDPTEFPTPSKMHGSYHWTFERTIAAALVPLVGSSMMTSAHPILDGVLAVTLILHSHVGIDSSVTDYLHVRKFPKLGPAATWGLRAASVSALIGLYEFSTNDVGITELVAKLWHA